MGLRELFSVLAVTYFFEHYMEALFSEEFSLSELSKGIQTDVQDGVAEGYYVENPVEANAFIGRKIENDLQSISAIIYSFDNICGIESHPEFCGHFIGTMVRLGYSKEASMLLKTYEWDSGPFSWDS